MDHNNNNKLDLFKTNDNHYGLKEKLLNNEISRLNTNSTSKFNTDIN